METTSLDDLAELLADLPLPLYCWEVRQLARAIIHQRIGGRSAVEQAFEWALAGAALERAVRLRRVS
jgi:hypothetical protein